MINIASTVKHNAKKLFGLIKIISLVDIIFIAAIIYIDRDLIICGFNLTGLVFLLTYILLLFWMLCIIWQLCVMAHTKYDKQYKQFIAYTYYIFVIPLGFLWILMLLALFTSGDNGEFDKCMEQCVLPDKTNIKECAFNYCDPVF